MRRAASMISPAGSQLPKASKAISKSSAWTYGDDAPLILTKLLACREGEIGTGRKKTALRPAYPIKRQPSAQRTQASQDVKNRKRLPPA